MIRVDKLLWDEWNIEHIARHQVVSSEVEQVCHSNHVVLHSYAGRLLVIGPTQAKRMLAVILDPEEDATFYVVTARPASRKELHYYNDQKGGELND